MAASDGHGASRHSLRILVVDDLRDTADSMARLLALWGHETRTAYDGASALAVLGQFQPNIVLLDVAMPGMDGITVVQSMREAKVKQPRLIAVSGLADEHHRRLALTAGFDDYLAKPVPAEILRAALAGPRPNE